MDIFSRADIEASVRTRFDALNSGRTIDDKVLIIVHGPSSGSGRNGKRSWRGKGFSRGWD